MDDEDISSSEEEEDDDSSESSGCSYDSKEEFDEVNVRFTSDGRIDHGGNDSQMTGGTNAVKAKRIVSLKMVDESRITSMMEAVTAEEAIDDRRYFDSNPNPNPNPNLNLKPKPHSNLDLDSHPNPTPNPNPRFWDVRTRHCQKRRRFGSEAILMAEGDPHDPNPNPNPNPNSNPNPNLNADSLGWNPRSRLPSSPP